MHQESAPLPQSENPAPSPRGRCALCLAPILETQESHHVPTMDLRYPTDMAVRPAPYQHKDCPE